MSNPKFSKSLAARTVRVMSSEEPGNFRDMQFDDALDAARSDLGPIVSGEIIFRNERGDEYTLTFDDENDE